MKTLSDPEVKKDILQRLETLQPTSSRRWGSMSAHQMLCHLCDSFRGSMGEKPLSPAPGYFARGVYKWLALYLPVRWPHGVKTRPEMDQKIGGTPPVNFESDRQDLGRLLDRFSAQPREFQWRPHPIFGLMSDADWMRWAYLHMDHHLRQFGI